LGLLSGPKVSQAESSIESALQFMPFPRANYYLRAGRIYEKAGKIQKATESYKKVLAIKPENNVALKRLKVLR
jgi:Tfp pilus assembly protein PilF